MGFLAEFHSSMNCRSHKDNHNDVHTSNLCRSQCHSRRNPDYKMFGGRHSQLERGVLEEGAQGWVKEWLYHIFHGWTNPMKVGSRDNPNLLHIDSNVRSHFLLGTKGKRKGTS